MRVLTPGVSLPEWELACLTGPFPAPRLGAGNGQPVEAHHGLVADRVPGQVRHFVGNFGVHRAIGVGGGQVEGAGERGVLVLLVLVEVSPDPDPARVGEPVDLDDDLAFLGKGAPRLVAVGEKGNVLDFVAGDRRIDGSSGAEIRVTGLGPRAVLCECLAHRLPIGAGCERGRREERDGTDCRRPRPRHHAPTGPSSPVPCPRRARVLWMSDAYLSLGVMTMIRGPPWLRLASPCGGHLQQA